jgi:hypothetical protein
MDFENNNQTKIGRRRKILVEKISIEENLPSILSEITNPSLFPFHEPLRKNRFVLHLENDKDNSINPNRIRNFKIEQIENKKTITITSLLCVQDWIDDFKKMNMVKIFFLDPIGNVCQFMDFDIVFSGYSIGGDYESNELLIPSFKYIIIE